MANQKHLTLNERFSIASMLEDECSFKHIGLILDKDPTTISKEIRGHIVFMKTDVLIMPVFFGSHVTKGWSAAHVILRAIIPSVVSARIVTLIVLTSSRNTAPG